MVSRILIILVCLLAPMTDVKLGDVQVVEIVSFLVVFILLLIFIRNGLRFRTNAILWRLQRQYYLFLMLSAILALSALRLEFNPPPNISWLKSPFILSFARIAQLGIAITVMVALLSLLRRDERLLNLFTKSYILVGVLNALYGIISCVLFRFMNLDIGGAYQIDKLRAKAFFVEGGPFGIYLVSVILVALTYFRMSKLSGLLRGVTLAILLTALLLTNSKAGFLLSMALGLWYAFLASRLRFVFGLVIILFIPFLYVLVALSGYISGYTNFAVLAETHPDDPALVMGRVMAAYLVPRMIAHHPLLGIGIGNYSLMRNNQEYLQGFPLTQGWDLPGLGLIGYTAELGVPLFLMIVYLLYRPVLIVKRQMSPPLVILLAGYQLFACFFGVQLNFIYPWLITALALAYAFRSGTTTPIQSRLLT